MLIIFVLYSRFYLSKISVTFLGHYYDLFIYGDYACHH